MTAGEILKTALELVLALIGVAVAIFILTSRRLTGLGAFLLGGAASNFSWLAVWLEWFSGQNWSWWDMTGSTALTFYVGGMIGAIAWSYLDDQRERREATEAEAAETRQRTLGSSAH